MEPIKRRMKRFESGGFTLIEIIAVVVILGIAAVMAMPLLSSGADMQARAAADRMAADLDYAKGLAVTHQKSYTVVFNPSGDAYDIRLTSTDAVITNPVQPSQNYVVDFDTDSRVSRVDITDADFDSNSDYAVTFNYLGSPYSGKGTTSPLNSGRITLQADNYTVYVDIEPVTGYVTITGP